MTFIDYLIGDQPLDYFTDKTIVSTAYNLCFNYELPDTLSPFDRYIDAHFDKIESNRCESEIIIPEKFHTHVRYASTYAASFLSTFAKSVEEQRLLNPYIHECLQHLYKVLTGHAIMASLGAATNHEEDIQLTLKAWITTLNDSPVSPYKLIHELFEIIMQNGEDQQIETALENVLSMLEQNPSSEFYTLLKQTRDQLRINQLTADFDQPYLQPGNKAPIKQMLLLTVQ